MRLQHSLATYTADKVAVIAAVGVGSLFAGLTEAAFLILAVNTALALIDASTQVELASNIRVNVLDALAISGALIAARLLLALVVAHNTAQLAARTIVQLRTGLATAYLHSSLKMQEDEADGTFHHTLVGLPSECAGHLANITIGAGAALNLAVLIAASIYAAGWAFLMVLGALTMLVILLEPLRRAIRNGTKTVISEQLAYSKIVSETKTMALDIQSFAVEEPTLEKLNDQIELEASAQKRLALLNGSMSHVYVSLLYGTVVLGLLGAHLSGFGEAGNIGAAGLLMLRSLTYGQQLQAGLTAAAQLEPVTNELQQREMSYLEEHREPSSTSLSHALPITVRDLRFEYSKHEPVFAGLSFDLSAGEIIGIRGESGAGKTTLIEVLLGLRTPTGGTILADGKNLLSVTRKSWHRLVALVPQHPHLISGTIEENIRFYRTGISDQDVRDAAQAAQLSEVIDALPSGIRDDLGHLGHALSGGEQQRVAIARALVGGPELLVLDEPTSALDPAAEQKINSVIQDLSSNVAVIVVSHKPSTLSICQQVIDL